MEWLLIKTLLSLTAVLGLMLAVVFLLKKLAFGGKLSSKDHIEVTLLGSKSLQAKKTIQVVRILNKILVLGVSERGIEKLAEFESEGNAQEDGIPEPRQSGSKKPKPFLEHLSGSITTLVARRDHIEKQLEGSRSNHRTRMLNKPREVKTV